MVNFEKIRNVVFACFSFMFSTFTEMCCPFVAPNNEKMMKDIITWQRAVLANTHACTSRHFPRCRSTPCQIDRNERKPYW